MKPRYILRNAHTCSTISWSHVFARVNALRNSLSARGLDCFIEVTT